MPPPTVPNYAFPCGHTAGTVDASSVTYGRAKHLLWTVDAVMLKARYVVVCSECGSRHRAVKRWQLLDTYYEELKAANAFEPHNALLVART
jgi:hypothetical protein